MTNVVTPAFSPNDPLKTLLLFHRSVRASLDAFDALIAAADSGRVDEYKAAALHDFFTGPMRWHDLDERESVLKPLALVDPSFVDAVAVAVHEHAELQNIVDRIVEHLGEIGCKSAWPRTDALRASARELRSVVEPHLEREERELFPAARARLDAAALLRIEAEIAAREEARKQARSAAEHVHERRL
jgi:hemerythrin-like domain-containing protein